VAVEVESVPWRELQHLIEKGDKARIKTFLDSLAPLDAALIVSRLDDWHRAGLLAAIAPGDAAAVVEQMPEAQIAGTFEQLEPVTAAAILGELPHSERADLLGEVTGATAEAILGAMPLDEARSTRELREYPDDVAGGLMTIECLVYPAETTGTQVLEDMRAHGERYRDFVVQYAFVTAADGKLVGVLRLRDLLFGPRDSSIRNLMVREPLAVKDTATLDELRVVFDTHPFFGVPVVDSDGRLLGVVRRGAYNEALADRSEDALLKVQGIVGGEELRSMPLWRRSRRRLSWLSVNILLNVVAASVIAMYQETLAAVIALAVFLPIISDMSGCSGNQAVAVSMRELSLGLLRPSEFWRVWRKEAGIGLINGLALGLLLGAVAWAWKGNVVLGLVVGAAMMLNTLVAVSIGGTVPLALRRMGVDPALASSPILTTVTDMCGFFLLLSIAAAVLPRLVGG
jgi:magnesium transporter